MKQNTCSLLDTLQQSVAQCRTKIKSEERRKEAYARTSLKVLPFLNLSALNTAAGSRVLLPLHLEGCVYDEGLCLCACATQFESRRAMVFRVCSV